MDLVLANIFSLLSIAATRDGVSAAVPKWLNFVAAALESNHEVKEKLTILKSMIETMVEQGREPTGSEWIALRERSNLAHQEIQEWVPAG